MPTKINLKNKRFSSLVVLFEAGKNKWGAYFWKCLCDCGKEKIIRSSSLIQGRTRSCGCGVVTAAKEPKTHGKTHTKIYQAWQAMKARCKYKKSKEYKNYGGRGITVCERWAMFENFYSDMFRSYWDGAEIDRIDTNGNYEPGNCRWVNRKTQQRNKRNNHVLTIGNKSMTLVEWGDKTGIKANTILTRIRRGWPQHRLLKVANG